MSRERNFRLFQNASSLFLLQGFNYILPLILLPYLTRILGIYVYGVYAFSISVIQVSNIFTDFGFNLSATYSISKNRYKKKYINKVIGSVYLIKIALCLFVSLLVLIFFIHYPKYQEYKGFLCFSILPIAGLTFQPVWFFQGIEDMKYITIYTGLTKCLYVVLVIAFVKNPDHLIRIAYANGFCQTLAAIISWRIIKKLGYSPKIPSFRFIKKVFDESKGFFLSRAAVATYTTAGSFFLGLFSSPKQVAIYSASEQLYKASQNIFFPVIQALYPFMAHKPNYKLFFRILGFSILAVFVVCLVGYIFSPYIIEFVYGAQFIDSYRIFKVFLIMFVITIPSIMLGYPFLGSFGRANLANASVIIAGVLQVFMLIGLFYLKLFTAIYVTIAVLIVEIVVLILRCIFGLRLFASIRPCLVKI